MISENHSDTDFQRKQQFDSKGYYLQAEFLSVPECEQLLAHVNEYRNNNSVPLIHRSSGNRPLHYSVIDGERIRFHLPEVVELYEEINRFVCDLSVSELVPLADEKVACNINITSKDGSYRWHYDRNAVTAILFLNEVGGGETDCYPNYRLTFGGNRYSVLQRWFDRLLQTAIFRRVLGKLVVIKPQAGTLLVMRGDKCLHSVRPVTGDDDRINIIASFDAPGKNYAVAGQLNDYLYSQEGSSSPKDPNYE